MHEYSLMNSLLNKIQHIAEENDALKVVGLEVKIGALAHISGDHFREHFVEGSRGTIMESAELHIEEDHDESSPDAQDILLKNVTIE